MKEGRKSFMEIKHVEGEDLGSIMLYALSTCPWCKKTKTLLQQLGVKYDYVDVDLLSEDEQLAIEEELSHWTDDLAFPTLIINNQTVIVGYQEQKIRNAVESFRA